MHQLEEETESVSSKLEKLNHDRPLDHQSSKTKVLWRVCRLAGVSRPGTGCVIPPLPKLPDQKMTLMWRGRWNGFAVSPASETNRTIRLLQVSGELV